MIKSTFKPARQEAPPILRAWIPCLPIALVKGKTNHYLVNYELRTCTCPDHEHRKYRYCRHLVHVLGLVSCRAATEPLQYEKGLWL